MEINENKSKIINIIVFVLVFLVFVYNVYLIFLVPDQKRVTAEPNKNTLTQEQKNSLLDYVPILNNSINYPGGYRSQKTTIKDVENMVILNMGYKFIIGNDKNLTGVDGNFNTTYCTDAVNYRCFAFTKDNLAKVLRALYGDDINYRDEDFQIGSNESNKCSLINGNYNCVETLNTQPNSIGKSSAFLLSKEGTDEITIYEKAIFLVDASTRANENNYSTTIGKIYKFNNTENLIAQDMGFNSTEQNYAEYLIGKLGDKVQIFKSTFKKGTADNYYWVSTEPVASTEG